MVGTGQIEAKSAALYLRISDDREGRALGVARQETDCRALAERRGWTIVDVYPDNDVSASKSKPRPEYNRMLEDIRTGRIDGVIVWDIDRLVRKPAELEEFIALAELHQVALASVGGEIDLGTPQGRLTARIKGSVARHETEQQQRRILRKVDELVAAGLPHVGGGSRPFGYTKDRMSIVEDEAELIREAAKRVLTGESRSAIVHEWNDRGLRTTANNAWTLQTLTWMLRSGRIAGQVERHRKIVGPAAWPAIIDLETHTRLRETLAAKTPFTRPPRLLLSGIAICSRCEHYMRGHKGNNGRPNYICPPKVSGGCNGVVIKRIPTEAHVVELLLRHIEQIADAELGPDDVEDPRLAKIRELQAVVDRQQIKLDKLKLAYADDDDAEAVDFRDASRLIRERIQATQVEIARETAQLGIQLDDPAAVRANWDDEEITPLARKRQYVGAFIERITILPASRPSSLFDPKRIRINWR